MSINEKTMALGDAQLVIEMKSMGPNFARAIHGAAHHSKGPSVSMLLYWLDQVLIHWTPKKAIN